MFETMSSMVLVFLAFGVGLDPRQKMFFGAALGHIPIGIAPDLCEERIYWSSDESWILLRVDGCGR